MCVSRLGLLVLPGLRWLVDHPLHQHNAHMNMRDKVRQERGDEIVDLAAA